MFILFVPLETLRYCKKSYHKGPGYNPSTMCCSLPSLEWEKRITPQILCPKNSLIRPFGSYFTLLGLGKAMLFRTGCETLQYLVWFCVVSHVTPVLFSSLGLHLVLCGQDMYRHNWGACAKSSFSYRKKWVNNYISALENFSFCLFLHLFLPSNKQLLCEAGAIFN